MKNIYFFVINYSLQVFKEIKECKYIIFLKHYENIQIHLKFYHQKMKIFR